MRCVHCQTENAAHAAFCGGCGRPLGPLCSDCGTRAPPGCRFCTECGAPIEPESGPGIGSGVAPRAISDRDGKAERRQLTLLFCDVVDSTRIAAALGAEDWREMLRSFQAGAAEIVERFEGFVAQYLGDGVLAYFGYPSAHEDDAERAVRAGLAIADAVAARRPELEERYGRGLFVRIGINTGPVVVGDVGGGERHEMLAVGAASNLAAHVQAEAEPDAVLITSATLELVRGIFVTVDLGGREADAFGAPVRLHRVIGPSGARSRFEVRSIEGLAPFVGRGQEIGLLLERWRRARSGHGTVVLLTGDAGIGKSRLVRELREHLPGDSLAWIECRASKFHTDSAFHPLGELIEESLGLRSDDAPQQRWSRLAEGLEAAGFGEPETVSLFASLLGLPPAARDVPPTTDRDSRRSRMLEALVEWLLSMARSQPAVIVIEDLHWIDPSSLDLLELLQGRVSALPVLLLLTFRTGFEPPWRPPPDATLVTLEPLTPSETEAMVEGIAGGVSLPPAVLEQMVKETDGVPLFVEEFTRSLLESGLMEREDGRERAEPLHLAVPATLQDSLMARLDRLGPAKGVAQLAAVLGRDFSYELLAAVSTGSQSLEADLYRLVSAGILQREGRAPNATYSFRHALIQETAYRSLLRATRRSWHARVARIVEERFAALAAVEPQRVAWHFEEGGEIEKAVFYYGRAGERAVQQSASAEAIRHLGRGIELLRKLPQGPARNESELVLQSELGTILVATKGWGSPEAEVAYARARELCERVGEPPQLFQVLRGLITFYTARAELETARDLAGRLLELAERSGESSLRLIAHEHLAILHYFLGSPSTALEHSERAVALYEPSEHRYITHLYGEDLGVFSRIWMAWTLWILGYPDQAVARSREALRLGESAAHPFSLAYALLWASILHVMRREPDRARQLAEQAVAISEARGFAFVLAGARLVKGWARLAAPLAEEERERAADEFRACVTRIGATGNRINAPMMLCYLADAYRRAGLLARALVHAEAGLALSRQTQQTQWDAELYRVQGELALQHRSDEREAERLFRRSMEVAQRQGAKSLELRGAIGLGRLWQRQKKAEPLQALLAPIYAWFTEGFDSPDLVEARALLAGHPDRGGTSHD